VAQQAATQQFERSCKLQVLLHGKPQPWAEKPLYSAEAVLGAPRKGAPQVLFCCAPLRGFRERPCRRSCFLAQVVAEPVNPSPLKWSDVGAAVILGGAIVFGVIANGRTLLDALVALAFGAFLLFTAWLSKWTLQQAQTDTMTRWQWIWQAAVFMLSLGAAGALVWWCVVAV